MESSLAFRILINGLCVLLVIYPACCAIRHLNKGNPLTKKWQHRLPTAFLVVAEVAICRLVFTSCGDVFNEPISTIVVFGLLVAGLLVLILGVTIVSHKKLTAQHDGNLWEIMKQLTDSNSTICIIAVVVCVITFWFGVSLTLYPIMQGATL